MFFFKLKWNLTLKIQEGTWGKFGVKERKTGKTRHVIGSSILNLISGGKFPVHLEFLANTPPFLFLGTSTLNINEKELTRAFKEIDIF